MHNGTGKALVSCLYPIEYLNEHFLSYEPFLDNTILLMSTLSILIIFLFLWNTFLLIYLSPKIKAFCSFFWFVKKKKTKNVYVDTFALR